jgi:hypothetical protein
MDKFGVNIPASAVNLQDYTLRANSTLTQQRQTSFGGGASGTLKSGTGPLSNLFGGGGSNSTKIKKSDSQTSFVDRDKKLKKNLSFNGM